MDLNDKLHTQDSDILKHSPICLMFHFKWDNVLQNKHHACTKYDIKSVFETINSIKMLLSEILVIFS